MLHQLIQQLFVQFYRLYHFECCMWLRLKMQIFSTNLSESRNLMPASDKCTRARHTVAFACNLRLFQHCSSSCLVIVKIHKRSRFRFLVQRSTLLFSDVNKALGKPVMYTHTKKSTHLNFLLLYFTFPTNFQTSQIPIIRIFIIHKVLL